MAISYGSERGARRRMLEGIGYTYVAQCGEDEIVGGGKGQL
jgi:hypothetical protein